MKQEEITKFQNTNQSKVLRSSIKFASYNPRTISEKSLKALKANIKRIGLLGGIVINKKTSNIVSGHQRVTALDQLNKYKEETKENDYTFIAEIVELDEIAEKEQNVFMNSTSAQGEFDNEKLSLLLPDIDYKNAGLDDYDIGIIAAESPNINFGNNSEVEEDIQEMDKPFEDRKEAIKEKKQKAQEKIENDMNEGDPYFTVTFDSYQNKAEFLETLGFNAQDRYIKGELLFDKISE